MKIVLYSNGRAQDKTQRSTGNTFERYFYFMCISVLPKYIYVYVYVPTVPHVCVPMVCPVPDVARGTDPLELVMQTVVSLHECRTLFLGPLQEQPMFLTAELSFQAT